MHLGARNVAWEKAWAVMKQSLSPFTVRNGKKESSCVAGAIRKLSCTWRRRPASTRQAGYPPLIIAQSNVNKEPRIKSVFEASCDPNFKMLRIMHECTLMNRKTIIYFIINHIFVVFVLSADLQGHFFVLSHPAAAMLTDRLKATTDREWKWKDGLGEMGLDVGQKPLSDTTHPSELCCTEGWKGSKGEGGAWGTGENWIPNQATTTKWDT